MNLCILLGKIVSDIEFKFMINSKNKAIVLFEFELLNKSIVKIKAYDEMADDIYRKLKINRKVIIEGKIRGEGTIECEKFILPRKDSIFKNIEL